VWFRYTDYDVGGLEPLCENIPIATDAYNSGHFTVQANVPPSCEIVTLHAINLGMETSLATTLDAQATMRVNCSDQAPYSIAMDNGQNAQGPQRHMCLGSTPHLIQYRLYQNSNHTLPWGSNEAERKHDTGTGKNQSHTIYARIPGPQATPPPGKYTDTVVVTLYY